MQVLVSREGCCGVEQAAGRLAHTMVYRSSIYAMLSVLLLSIGLVPVHFLFASSHTMLIKGEKW